MRFRLNARGMLVACIKHEPLRQQNFHLCPSRMKYLGASLPLKSIYGLCFNPFLKLPLKSVGAHAWKSRRQCRTGCLLAVRGGRNLHQKVFTARPHAREPLGSTQKDSQTSLTYFFLLSSGF